MQFSLLSETILRQRQILDLLISKKTYCFFAEVVEWHVVDKSWADPYASYSITISIYALFVYILSGY